MCAKLLTRTWSLLLRVWEAVQAAEGMGKQTALGTCHTKHAEPRKWAGSGVQGLASALIQPCLYLLVTLILPKVEDSGFKLQFCS